MQQTAFVVYVNTIVIVVYHGLLHKNRLIERATNTV